MAERNMLADLASFSQEKARNVSDWWNDLRTFTEKADNEAETRFPGQTRDESVKNAYRHALGAGRLAQLLGGTEASRLSAKVAGYGWEALGGPENWKSQDMRHDLNANALGIEHSAGAKDFQSLADALASFTRSARKELPPEPVEPARGYFTYTK